MKAQITLTKDDVAKLLRKHLEQRGLDYADHVITGDGEVLVTADLGDLLLAPPQPAPLPLPAAPAAPRGPAREAPQGSPALSTGELLLPTEDPDEDSTDTSAPPVRSHPKSIDTDLQDQLAAILQENARLESQKGKK